MADGSLAALLIIISVTTSQTPKDVLDDTKVVVKPYPSMDSCARSLKKIPLSDIEKETEIKYKIRVIRSCMPVNGTGFYDYSWGDGRVVGDSLVETGPYRGK